MSELRTIAMSSEQAQIIDEVVIPGLMRAGDEQRAAKMMALALAWKFAKRPAPEVPDNVVELHGYSRKAPCA